MLDQMHLLQWEQLRREAEQERLANAARMATRRGQRNKLRWARRLRR